MMVRNSKNNRLQGRFHAKWIGFESEVRVGFSLGSPFGHKIGSEPAGRARNCLFFEQKSPEAIWAFDLQVTFSLCNQRVRSQKLKN